jgi:hypothetical protein
MIKKSYKNFFIALLLLAFTSQSFAALLMPCQLLAQTSNTMNMDEMIGMDHSNMAGMDHSTMTNMDHSVKTALNESGTSAADCCKTLGHCASGSCFLAYFNPVFDFSFSPMQADANISHASAAPEAIVSSLFRPPIVC